jgi:hypothetical protein
MGMKVDQGLYAVYPVAAAAAAKSVGESIASLTTISVDECTKKCDNVESCVVVFIVKVTSATGVTSYTCNLRSGALASDVRSQYRIIDGSVINNWFIIA